MTLFVMNLLPGTMKEEELDMITTRKLAKEEHVWLLSLEGLSQDQIGIRMGYSRQRVNLQIKAFKDRMRRAMRRTKWRLL